MENGVRTTTGNITFTKVVGVLSPPPPHLVVARRRRVEPPAHKQARIELVGDAPVPPCFDQAVDGGLVSGADGDVGKRRPPFRSLSPTCGCGLARQILFDRVPNLKTGISLAQHVRKLLPEEQNKRPR